MFAEDVKMFMEVDSIYLSVLQTHGAAFALIRNVRN